MNVLVDTSVWIEHFRRGNDALVELLALDLVSIHPMILLELACGTPPAPRAKTLNDLSMLKSTRVSTLSEIQGFVERHQLYGQGCGLVDVSLLCSVIITPNTRLWSIDKRLDALAIRFGVGYQAKTH